ncbi:MAG: UDPGP type 1 family protein [Planctomycetes bacterium]|nr:UDPGP type 1 family protein [Planctomycetota bacterium]
MNTTTLDTAALQARLSERGQGHVLNFWSDLDQSGQDNLLREVSSLDLDLVNHLMNLAASPAAESKAPNITPPETITLSEVRANGDRIRAAREAGAAELKGGRVGFVLVAGGQASRLGCDGPKGDFPVGPVSGSTLFYFHAKRILRLNRLHQVRAPWYVMTSPANHEETQRIFELNGYFGLEREDVFFFCQKMLPALDLDGRVLLRGKGELSLAPNGHGGVLEGLASSGCLEDAFARGVKTLSYFQVDNPLVRPGDELFLGLHKLADAEMSSKVVRKSSAGEKVGVLGHVDGRLGCIEYSDMPEELLNKRDEDGDLVFSAGNIAVHALSVDFIAKITEGGLKLPWHVARKKIASVDATGSPCEEDGMKFETFVFDALGLANRSVTLEVDRAHEFAPVKNRQGADSPDTARALLCALHASWAGRCGLPLPVAGEDGVVSVEIDPSVAETYEQFQASQPIAPLVTEEGHLYH